MKLFKSLLIAPATLGLLAPFTAVASEVDFKAISKYSNSEYEIDSNSFKYLSTNNTLVSGGEGLVESDSPDSFSTTTSASFSVEAVLGTASAEDRSLLTDDGEYNVEGTSFEYQYQIGLTSSFTGEDSLDVTIDVGGAGGTRGTSITNVFHGFDATADAMEVDGITYTFPVGGMTMLVGDSTDVSAVYTGACAYSGFSDYMGDCGTGNSIGLGGAGATVAASYAFDSGFSLAGGLTSPNIEILGEDSVDGYGLELAYTQDGYGLSLAYSDVETSTFVGLNGFYSFDFATVSAGYETQDVEDDGGEGSAFFVGLTKEIGAGTAELGYGSTDLDFGFGAPDETGYIYEASYAYPVNDYLTITPGLAIVDLNDAETTFAAVKASFAF